MKLSLLIRELYPKIKLRSFFLNVDKFSLFIDVGSGASDSGGEMK